MKFGWDICFHWTNWTINFNEAAVCFTSASWWNMGRLNLIGNLIVRFRDYPNLIWLQIKHLTLCRNCGNWFRICNSLIEWHNIHETSMINTFRPTCHYPNQWWPSLLAHIRITRPQWVKMNRQELKLWWRHQMETFSALLAICAGNSPVMDK